MNERQLLAEANLGVQAHPHLEFLRPWIEILRKDLQRQWFETKASQHAEREEIWRQCNTLDLIEKKIIQIVETGKLAQASLQKRK